MGFPSPLFSSFVSFLFLFSLFTAFIFHSCINPSSHFSFSGLVLSPSLVPLHPLASSSPLSHFSFASIFGFVPSKQGFTRRRPQLSYKTVQRNQTSYSHPYSPSSSFCSFPLSPLLSSFPHSFLVWFSPPFISLLSPLLAYIQLIFLYQVITTKQQNPGLKVKQVTNRQNRFYSLFLACKNGGIIQ